MKKTILALIALAVAAAPAAAQRSVDQTVRTAATGSVTIENLAGSVRVVGWDRDEIRITGELGRGAERLDVSGGQRDTRIHVVIQNRSRNVRGTDLEIHVPRRKDVSVKTVSADIHVRAVTGELDAFSTSGDVDIAGEPAAIAAHSTSGDVRIDTRDARIIEARSTSGDVYVSGGSIRESVNVQSTSGDLVVRVRSPEARMRTVSGDMDVSGITGKATFRTVSGDVVVRDSPLQFVSFESVSGNFDFIGDVPTGAAFNLESHSGELRLGLPANVSADFEIDTFSGDIRSDFGGEARRKERYGPARELKFTVGRGGSTFVIRTFSGSVKLTRN